MTLLASVHFAGVEALVREKKLDACATVVVFATGHGLKAADKLEKLLGKSD